MNLIEDEETEELTNRKLSDEIFREINEGNAIKKSKWRAWKKKNEFQVSKGKLHLRILIKIITAKFLQESFLNFTKGDTRLKLYPNS